MRFFLIAFMICLLPTQAARGEQVALQELYQPVKMLLDRGFQQQRVAPEELERVYADVIRLVGGQDPHVDYAMSIVLRKNFVAEEAQTLLERAASRDNPAVFLAREELILQRLKKRQYADVLDLLIDLSQQVGRIPAESPQSSDAARSARWIGLLMAYLEGPLGRDEVKESVRSIEPQLANHLGSIYLGAYRAGRLAAAMRNQELMKEVSDVRGTVAIAKVQLNAEAISKEQEVSDQKAELKSQVSDFQDVASDSLSDLDSKLAVMDDQFQASLETEQSMVVTATSLRLQIEQLKRDANLTGFLDQSIRQTGQVRSNLRVSQYDQQIARLEQELLVLSQDYALLLESRAQLVAVAQRMLARRAQMTSQIQSAARGAAERQTRLDRMQKQIDKMKQKVDASLESDPKVAVKLRAMQEFRSYDKRGLEEERMLLLQSLHPDQGNDN